ncbi:hypothetical protein AA313_de0207535 [Arthrobotrys entomopaga]|nr:hypothetical protein AA313_de0207535 [Arthrobotrys entomopaga]
MPAEYIKTGVWELFDEPFHKRWILTLEDSQGFWLLGLFAVLLILVQPRAWYLLRYFVYHWEKPIQLDTIEAHPWLKISQMEAVTAMLHEIRDFCFKVLRMIPCLVDFVPAPSIPPYPVSHHYQSPIPYRFGITALVNGTGFILIGVLLPLLLTNWSTPLVQTRLMPYCDMRLGAISKIRHKETYADANAKYEQCWNGTTHQFVMNSGCSAVLPNINITTSDSCPFHPEVCMNNTRPIVIESKNISYKDMGLNSKSRTTVSHRLTCTPMTLDPFIYTRKEQHLLSVYSLASTEPDFNNDTSLQYMNLSTLNGPNKWSKESSGRAILESGSFSNVALLVWPIAAQVANFDPPEYPFHPFLRVHNASIFFVVYNFRSGSTYTYSIDDPVYSAHIRDPSRGEPIYRADFETTAIGCVETYQYCLNAQAKRYCTEWGQRDGWKRDIHFLQSLIDTEKWGRVDDIRDFGLIGLRVANLISVHAHVTWNVYVTRYLSIYNIAGRLPDREGQYVQDFSHSKTLWRDEIISWYLKTWWYAKARIQSAATTPNSAGYFAEPNKFYGVGAFEDQETADKWSWCSRTLLEDAGYTNINVFGFALSLILMGFIYLISYHETWRRVVRYIKKKYPIRLGFIWPLLNMATKFSFAVVNGTLAWCYRITRSTRNNGTPSVQLENINTRNRNQVSETNTRSEPRNMELFDEDETRRGGFDEYDFPLPMSNASQAWAPS